VFRRLAPAALAAALAACAGAQVPAGGHTGASQPVSAATAVAVGGAKGPVSPPGVDAASPRSSSAASVDGRMALAREDALVVVEAGRARILFSPPEGGRVKDPAWSPDGTSIAFAYAPPRPVWRPGAPTAESVPVSDVMVVGADGSDPRPLVAHEAPGHAVEGPAWTSDGGAVLYGSSRWDDAGGRVTLEVRRLDLAAAASTTIATGVSDPTVSRDGRWVAFVGREPRAGPTLQIAPSRGGSARTLIAVDEFSALLAPRFSPDGQTIAFAGAKVHPVPAAAQPRAHAPLDAVRRLLGPGTAFAHMTAWEIWTVPTAGGDLRQLTRVVQDMPYPAWSSDGARILVYGAKGLQLVDVAGARTDPLASDGSHNGMDWRSGG
jgi:Tol biopolymer transport system component